MIYPHKVQICKVLRSAVVVRSFSEITLSICSYIVAFRQRCLKALHTLIHCTLICLSGGKKPMKPECIGFSQQHEEALKWLLVLRWA